jgi:hypothetical protein
MGGVRHGRVISRESILALAEEAGVQPSLIFARADRYGYTVVDGASREGADLLTLQALAEDGDGVDDERLLHPFLDPHPGAWNYLLPGEQPEYRSR